MDMQSQLNDNGFRAVFGCTGRTLNVMTVRSIARGIARVTLTLRDNAREWKEEEKDVRYTGVDRALEENDLPAADWVLTMDAEKAKTTETEEALTVENDGLRVRLDKETGLLTFEDAKGNTLLRAPMADLQERPVVRYTYDDNEEVTYEESVDGIRARTRQGKPVTDRMGLTGRQRFLPDADEGIYGLGSHEEGYGNLRGKSRSLYQQNLKACVPAVVSTKGWELVFAMGGLMTWKDGEDGADVWVECADAFDFYFLYGDGSWRGVMERYAALTGKTPMPPRATFGYIQSKERYKDAQELIDVVSEYRRRGVPLDMIVLDWQSWPEGQWGYKTFDTERFPDPDAMTRELHRLGASMMISIWPSMTGDRNGNREEMLEKGMMLGNRTIYNAFDEEARKVYWRQACEGLFRHGIDAWWCDCTEPFEADWKGVVKPEEHERVALNTEEARKYCDPTKLSAYSFYHSKGIWDGQRAETSEKRVINLTRSSWVGQHRFGTVTWNGDTCATWANLKKQIPEGLNFAATGEGYWTVDAGAFFTAHRDLWFWRGDYNEGAEDPKYAELYTRWIQFAAFLPLMRSHGTDTPREIWRFGEKGTVWYDAIEKAICLRYTLFPYLYSLAAELTWTGLPMLRAPALVFPEDKNLRDDRATLMLGDALLARPITEPDCHEAETLLPAGCEWVDLWTGKRYAGGQTVKTEVTPDRIPVFLRGGSILPTVPVCAHTGDAMTAPLTVTVVPGADAAFTLYEDEGDGYGYENGKFARTVFEWKESEKTLTVRREETGWKAPERAMNVRLLGGKEISVGPDGTTVHLA